MARKIIIIQILEVAEVLPVHVLTSVPMTTEVEKSEG